MIGALNAYWGERGAVIMQPYHTELGAGTSNPATFIRVLDPSLPEWRAAYVARRGGRWRFHVVLRGRDPAAVLGGDPGRSWSVDVDPESLL